ALLGLFARHSSMARELHIFVASSDPLISRLLATPEFPQDLQMGWMLRVVSVVAALQSRGYNATVQATATLRVRDAELPGNDGAWTLRLEHGRMQVERGGSGGPEISIGALAALYSGFQSPD